MADVGAGTGGFSRVLATRAVLVVAVEPDVRMATLLAARSSGVVVVGGRGEALPLRPRRLDAVLVSSAWHWLDEQRALPEIARALRPGGVLGVVWNSPSRDVDWVGELLAGVSRQDGVPGPRHELSIPKGMPFAEPETRLIAWSLPRTPSELIGLAGTYSRVITASPEDRLKVAQRAAEILETDPRLRGRTRIDLPMTARCWRAVRLD